MYPCMRTVRATFLHALHVEITPKPVTQVTWYLQACTGSLVGVCCSAFGLQITLARKLRSAAGHLSSFGKSWLTYLVTQFVVIQIDCSAVRVCFPVLRLFPAVVSNTERTSSSPPWVHLPSLPNLLPSLDSLQQNVMFVLTSCPRWTSTKMSSQQVRHCRLQLIVADRTLCCVPIDL